MSMARDTYQESLEELRSDVLGMGEAVVRQADGGLAALESGDEELAREVIDGDDPINDWYLELESDCIDLFALQQPVASDLRFVAASFKILTDLERVGDLAANLAKYSLADDGSSLPEVGVVDIGRDAVGLLERSLDAYETGDSAACRAVAADDDEVDALCQRATQQVVRDLVEREAGNDLWTVEALLDDVSRLLLTVRDIERIADHAVNVAARTLYMTESDPELVY
jgi:phosphate transport system protein